MADADFALSRVGQIAIRTHDPARATAFYRDVLGLKLLFQFPPLAFFQCGEVRLMLAAAEAPEFDHPSSIIYFTVDQMDAAYETLRTRGVTFQGPPHVVHRAPGSELWMAFFHDSEENTLALMCEQRTA